MCGKGVNFKFSHEERANVSTFVIYNFHCMENFVEEYNEVISNAQVRRRGGKSSKPAPLSIMEWIHHRIKDGLMRGEDINYEQREIGLGCDRMVTLLSFMYL